MSSTSLPVTRRTVLGSAIGLSATALMAGCAKKDNASTGGGKQVLNVGQISNSVAFFPLYVAEQKGFFTKAGVTLGERPRLGTGAKLAAALKSGSIDLGAGVLTDAYNLHTTDSNARVYSGLVTEYYVDVVVGSSYSGPAADAPIDQRIQSLVGKKIGITGPGSGTEALLVYLFQQIGKDVKKDATLVNIGSVATAAVGALKAGRVDALSFFQPIGQIAEGQKVGSIYISPQRGDIPSIKGALHGCVFSTTTLVDKKKEAVAGFNKAIDEALALIQSNPTEAKTLLQAYLKSSSADVVDKLLEILPDEMSKTHKITQDSYEKGRNFHTKTGLAKNAPDFSNFVAPQARA